MSLLKEHFRRIKPILSAVLVLIVTSGAALAQTRVCNTGDVELLYAKAYDTDIPQVHGWFSLAPGKCMRDTSFGFWLAFVQRNSAGEKFFVDYGVNRPPDAYHSRRRFCVDPGGRFTHNMLSGSSCPPGFDLEQFSLHVPFRDGGLLGALTRINIPSRANIVPEPGPPPLAPTPSAQTSAPAASVPRTAPGSGSFEGNRDWLLITAGTSLGLVLAVGALVARRGGRPDSLAALVASGAKRARRRAVAVARRVVTWRMPLLAFGMFLGQIIILLVAGRLIGYAFVGLLIAIGGLIVVGAAAAAAATWARGLKKTLAALFLSGAWTMVLPPPTLSSPSPSYAQAAAIYALLSGSMLIGWFLFRGAVYFRDRRARVRTQQSQQATSQSKNS